MGFQFKRALSLVMRTKRYVLHRALIYGVLCVGMVVYLGILAGLGAIFGPAAFWLLFLVSAALVVMLGVAGFIGEFIFFKLKAGHIALITELISEGQLPEGISQIKWARGHVTHFFEEESLLPQALKAIRLTLRAINRSLVHSAAALPMPGVECGGKFTQHIVDFSQTYIEEAAVAYAFKSRNSNVLDAVRGALVLYCQAWKVILSQAVTLTLLSYCFVLLATVIFLIPLGIVAVCFVGPDWMLIKFVLFATGVFAGFAVKWAFYDPVACASIIMTFLEEGEIAPPDSEWEPKIESVSASFVELKQKAQAQESKPKRAARKSRIRRPARDKNEEPPSPPSS